MKNTKKLKIYCDGGSRGNPGPAASGYAVYENKKLIYKDSLFLGVATNNVSEYMSVLIALKWLSKSSGASDLYFTVDSQLVQKQLTGEYKIKNQKLKELAIKIKTIEKKISGNIYYKWSPREHNKIADQLVNDELDRQPKKIP